MVCSLGCALAHNQAQRLKRAKKEKREGRVQLRDAGDWTKLAQAEFNRYVRMRDEFLSCISCGDGRGGWDCGHFRSVGAAPELRFEEFNAAKQCKFCNGGGNKKRGYMPPLERQMTVRANYRSGLVARIGIEKVEWLEGPHEPKRYRIDELIQIRDHYRAKCKLLRFQRANAASFA